ncbi:MAG: 4-alpha-glucanotransferase [Candidatus Cloacimonetes bacterium]|nr:4-alpha-glucanotransferase [Candidatus Cloacimonadota bacterium]
MSLKQKGVLLHFSSLPGDFGIGDLGPEALSFAQFLNDQGYTIWQTLPLNHRGYGNSPYNPISAFALDPLLISPELLYEKGLVDAADLEEATIPATDRVFFEHVFRNKCKLLETAANRYLKSNNIDAFISQNEAWLKPYLTFLSLDRLYDEIHWSQWQSQHLHYTPELWQSQLRDFEPFILSQAAIQAILREQLAELKTQLKELNIELWGDLPIYLSYHSADVWANPHLFALDDAGNRLQVAGVPPDAFSEEGQLWGNPIYLWQERETEVFELITARIRDVLSYADRIRLDHFIGYVNYWSIPCPLDNDGSPILPQDAKAGEWIKAPAQKLFETITAEFGNKPFIAEDLGILTEEVNNIRAQFGFPGMIVLQFCWQDGEPDVAAYPADKIIYTGTHDNLTTRQWFEELDPESAEYQNFTAYVNSRPHLISNSDGKVNLTNAAEAMINIAQKSGCEICIFPMQDLLNLDAAARMNIPGTPLGNWEWRMPE